MFVILKKFSCDTNVVQHVQHALESIAKIHPYTELDVKNIKIGFSNVCVESNHSRDLCKGFRQRSTRILFGPIDPAAWNGCRYFVAFIDNC